MRSYMRASEEEVRAPLGKPTQHQLHSLDSNNFTFFAPVNNNSLNEIITIRLIGIFSITSGRDKKPFKDTKNTLFVECPPSLRYPWHMKIWCRNKIFQAQVWVSHNKSCQIYSCWILTRSDSLISSCTKQPGFCCTSESAIFKYTPSAVCAYTMRITRLARAALMRPRQL